jgi:hypothetical protein
VTAQSARARCVRKRGAGQAEGYPFPTAKTATGVGRRCASLADAKLDVAPFGASSRSACPRASGIAMGLPSLGRIPPREGSVMAGACPGHPGLHARQAWMPATSAGMTKRGAAARTIAAV